MERITTFDPAFDKRDPNPSNNYGIGAVVCRMVLKGEKGAVQFVFSTGVYLPHVADELIKSASICLKPMGHDVGYHSPRPLYDGQEPMHDDCEYTGGVCYYDGSGLRAEEWLRVLITQGGNAVWKLLEQEYAERFGPF